MGRGRRGEPGEESEIVEERDMQLDMVEVTALTHMCSERGQESVDDQDTRDDQIKLGRDNHLTDMRYREVFEMVPLSSVVSRPLSGRWIETRTSQPPEPSRAGLWCAATNRRLART